MPRLSISGNRMNKASDSDESFHCCGRPEDLALDPPTPRREPTRPRKEIFVPENPDFYCYESGMARHKQEESKRLSALEASGSSSRASIPPIVGRIQSSDSDKTLAEEPLLVIHTGVSPLASSSRRTSQTRRLEPSPTKRKSSRRASLSLSFFRASSRKAVSQSRENPKPPQTRFSLFQTASKRFSSNLYNIGEVDRQEVHRRPSVEPHATVNDSPS